MGTTSESAAEAWDHLWAALTAAGHELPPPHPDVARLAGDLWQAGVRRVYDLGCGAGRHTVYLAARGFEAYASDLSAVAAQQCRAALAAAGLQAEVTEAPMTHIAYPDAFFDWTLAVGVVYHARRSEMEAALAEVRRTLRPGGWLYITFLSTADEKLAWYRRELAAGRAEELGPDTYRALVKGPTDEHVPHSFVTAADLGAATDAAAEGSSGFRVPGSESLQDSELGTRNSEPGTRNSEPGTRNPEPGTGLLAGFGIVELREERQHQPDFYGRPRYQARWNVVARGS